MSSDGYYLFAGDGSLTWETALTNNVTYAVRVILGSVPIDRLGVEIVTAQASSAVRMGVYEDADGIPGDVVLDAGTVATTSTGIRQVSFSPLDLDFGLYWVTATPQNSGSMPVYVAQVDLSWQDFLQTKTMTVGHQHTGSMVDANGYTGALGQFGAPGTPTRVCPRIFYRNFSSDNVVEMSGSGALSATGVHLLNGAVALTGTGTLSATGVHRLNGSVALTGSGTLSATGTVTTPAPANLVTNGSGTDSSSYTTSNITPASNHLVLALVESSVTSGTPNTPTVSGNGLTWVQLATRLDTAGDNRTTLFRALKPSPTNGGTTFDFGGQTQTDCFWSIIQYAGVNTSGTNGSGAVNAAGMATWTQDSTSTLGLYTSSPAPGNPVYGGFGLNGYRTTSVNAGSNAVTITGTAFGLSGTGTIHAISDDTGFGYMAIDLSSPGTATGIAIEVVMA